MSPLQWVPNHLFILTGHAEWKTHLHRYQMIKSKMNLFWNTFTSQQSRRGYSSSFNHAWPGKCLIGLMWRSSLHKHTKTVSFIRKGVCHQDSCSSRESKTERRPWLIFTCTETVREIPIVSFSLGLNWNKGLAECSDAMSDLWQKGEQCHHGWVVGVVLVEAKGCRFNPFNSCVSLSC